MSEFSDWFKDTFKNCYCNEGTLVDEKRFAEVVQLVLDNEADEESLALFQKKINSCVKSNFTFEKEKCVREEIQKKLATHTGEIPEGLAQMIRKSVNL